MNPLILMAAVVVVPVLLMFITGSKAASVFLALCAGSVLSTYVGDTALDMVQTFVRGYNETTMAAVEIGLLVFPALLTMLFLGRSQHGSQKIINIFPAVLTGMVALFMVVPLLPSATMKSVQATEAWQQLYAYQAIFVGAAVLFSLFQLWASGSSSRHKKGKHGKK